MTQKTFQFDDMLATKFKEFCRVRMLVEKRTVSAALVHFMQLDAMALEEVILNYEKWRSSQPAYSTTTEKRRK